MRLAASGISVISSNSWARRIACRCEYPRCTIRGSAIWAPTVIVGFSEDIGSWKIMAMSVPRISRPSAACPPRMSCPRSLAVPRVIRPGGVWINPMTLCTETVFPQPDSPTIASVSPSLTLKLAPRTAWTEPPCTENSTCRSLTSRSAMD